MAICPYCENEVTLNDIKEESKKLTGMFHRLTMFSCPKCGKILGFSQSRSR